MWAAIIGFVKDLLSSIFAPIVEKAIYKDQKVENIKIEEKTNYVPGKAPELPDYSDPLDDDLV